MPPRVPHPQGLDEVSRMIGELSAYMHEGRHGVNNLSTKFDALAIDIAKRVEAMRTELSIRLDGMDARIAALEATADQNRGAKNLVTWFLQSPLIGWIAAGVMLAVAWWKKP
jgi:hypothetical protein